MNDGLKGGLLATRKALGQRIVPVRKRMKLKRFAIRLISLPRAFAIWTKYLRSPKYILPGGLELNVKLSLPELQLLLLDGWYHDFEIFGIKTGMLHPNQRCKQGALFALIDRAVSICREYGSLVRGVELFCADGYYANCAIRSGASEMYGIDIDNYYITKARIITKVLGNSVKVRFDCRDVFDLKDTFDFCICAGGLYHLSNPHELLRLLATKIRVALIIQTVYSLKNMSSSYFESPAPGWAHGCRFSLRYLVQMVKDTGWTILSESTNQLEGNMRLEDRGSVYLLCVPAR